MVILLLGALVELPQDFLAPEVDQYKQNTQHTILYLESSAKSLMTCKVYRNLQFAKGVDKREAHSYTQPH